MELVGIKHQNFHITEILFGVLVLGFLNLRTVQCGSDKNLQGIEYSALSCRKHTASLVDFGGVPDGKTSNTKAFKAAIDKLSTLAGDGGAQLVVPPGKWLTGSFNLTSHFTLFIQQGATLLASQDESGWPLLPALPSYGDKSSPGRYSSLIYGTNLTDVIITGNNGTIDGQGKPWWEKYKKGEFKNTRPCLIEIVYSDHVQISNVTLIDSPAWNVHPVYSSNILIQGVTILAPIDSENTDGINPDSCTNTRIEDCFVVSADDCVAVKSGIDQFGIKFGMPTQQLIIRRLACISPRSAAIALGSEMSGGVKDVRAEDIVAINTESGVRIKTAIGRGGYVKDIFVRRMTLKTMKYVFWMAGDYKSHPSPGFDPHALPKIENINYNDITAENVTLSASLEGIQQDPFAGICISNAEIGLSEKAKKLQWDCSDVAGVTSRVTPKACTLLPEKEQPMDCPFPDDKLPIEDIPLQKCTI
ncbi:probable polygalacturonase [Carica papaya]|uniref:probable polygalacturonase n=1 Tax=Carica papaya TaxID=3649 RepID=UPI000B8CB42F|nr:probable polygalacturonase [Carica papaya]